MTESEPELQGAIMHALELQSTGSWSKLEKLRRKFLALELCSRLATLNALCSNPLKTLEDDDKDLIVLSDFNPVSACAIGLSRLMLSLAIEHILAGRQELAETALRKSLACSVEAVVAARVSVPSAIPEELFSKLAVLVDTLASQLDFSYALKCRHLPEHITLVLGMHRSGTSALSGLLVQSGLEGPSDLMPATIKNPKGYFESISIMDLNNQLLGKLGSSWSSTRLIKESCWINGSASINDWRRGMLAILHDVYRPGCLALLKDPRLCILTRAIMPWLDSGLIPFFVLLPIRHPAEVVESLHLAEGLPRIQCLELWLRYVLESERNSRGTNRLIISYYELVDDPVSTISNCREALSSDPLLRGMTLLGNDAASAFIDHKLHRQHATLEAPDWLAGEDSTLLYDFALIVYSALTNKCMAEVELQYMLDNSWRQWQTLLAC